MKCFIISLPRTGTSSLCEMARICGLRPVHNPTRRFPACLDEYDFFADTPCYFPWIVSTFPADSRLIYAAKDPAAWYASWQRMDLRDGYGGSMAGLSAASYATVFHEHRRRVFDAAGNRPLLVYDFAQGWEPFCKFLELPIPTGPLPWLNRHSCFDFVPC